MKRITQYGITAAAVAGLLTAGAGAAFADSPPAGGTPNAASIGLTIVNPASATVTVSAATESINALTNATQATAAPAIGGPDTENKFTGGDQVSVSSNNADGYTLDASSSDLASTHDTQPAWDLNIEATDFPNAGNVLQYLSGHLGAAAGTLADPAYLPILSNTGTSQGDPQLTDWDLGHNGVTEADVESALPLDGSLAGWDETQVAFWVQPNTLLGSAAGYSATVSFDYIPNA